MGVEAFLNWVRLPSADRSVADVWINDDIRPLPPTRRTWNTLTFLSFWLTNQIASMHIPQELHAFCPFHPLATWTDKLPICSFELADRRVPGSDWSQCLASSPRDSDREDLYRPGCYLQWLRGC